MGVYVWKGPAGVCDYNDVTNWDLGAVPGNNDVILFPRGSSLITLNTDQSSKTPSRVFVGRDFAGQLGDVAAPLKYGNMNELRFDGHQCQACFFQTTGICAKAFILDAKADNYACYLIGGTFTELDVYKAGLCRIGAAATVPTLNVSGRDGDADARVEIMSGAAMTTINQDAGYIVNRAALTTLNLNGERTTFEHLGSETVGNIAAVNHNDGLFLFKAKKRTIAAYVIRRGTLDAREDPEDKTITTLTRWAMAKTLLDNGTNRIKITNDIIEMGFHMGGPGRNTTWAIPPIT